MVCIDQLIHAFHVSLRDGQLNRSFANNLIEGSYQQMIEFLHGLSALPGGVDKSEWRAQVATMFRRRRGRGDPIRGFSCAREMKVFWGAS